MQGKIQRDGHHAATPSQRSSRAPALDLMPPRLGETGVPRSDPTVLLGWSWSRAACSFSARGRRVDMLRWRFCAQRRHPRRRQVCARRDALSSWREVRRPLPHRAGPSRSSTPDAFAPQARLDPPRGWSGLGVGSCPRLALRAAWSPSSSPSCALRADRTRAAGATPHASPSRSRVPPPPPLACPPRGAPPGLARPRPRRARLPTPAPRPRQIGSRGRRPCAGHNHYDATVPQ